MTTAAGKRDRLIVVQQVTRTRDALGSYTETVSPLMTVWASKVETGGREILRGGQLVADVDAIFTILWPDTAINTTMRVVDNSGITYQIVKLSEVERRAGVEILAKAMPASVSMGGA